MKTFGTNELPDMSAAYAEIQERTQRRWQDDDMDNKWYEKSDVDGKISKREKEAQKKKLKKEETEIDESRLAKKITRPIRRAKKVAGRIAQHWDDDPGKAHTIGSLGNPNMRNDEKAAQRRKNQKKYRGVKVKEEVQVEGHQRDPDQQKKDRHHSKQPDPSKDGFTGIGNMSIDDIMKLNAKIKAKDAKKSKKEEVENDAQEINEISADLALKASKKAEVERGKAAVAGNRERAVAKLKQSSRLYAKQAAKRRKENAGG